MKGSRRFEMTKFNCTLEVVVVFDSLKPDEARKSVFAPTYCPINHFPRSLARGALSLGLPFGIVP